jgi:hypothetical protein
MSRFADVKDKIVFAEEEEAILKYWEEIDAFQTSIKLSEGKPEYTFYDGPPFATGLPHYGYVFCCVWMVLLFASPCIFRCLVKLYVVVSNLYLSCINVLFNAATF